jgi:hypothetical protein
MPVREVEREILKDVLNSLTFDESRGEHAGKLRGNDDKVPV